MDATQLLAEITLRTADAVDGIRAITTEVPDMLVGAGSIRTNAQMKAAQDAGASFCVCPGASDALLDVAEDLHMPFVPGACTPSEALELMDRGYKMQKFFPAEQSGGIRFLKALGGPLPEVSFMPTGGITPENASAYLQLENVACIGGSWITPLDEQRAGNFAAITQFAEDSLRRNG